MSQLDRLTTCDVTSAARGGKGGNVDALFFEEQWRKSERDFFFLTFEGISVRNCKDFFFGGLRVFFSLSFSYFFIALNDITFEEAVSVENKFAANKILIKCVIKNY